MRYPPPTTRPSPRRNSPSPPGVPPGPRDWLAYRLVKVQQLTTREAAKELGISQTRVCQLIDRVVEYMTDVAPGCESPEARGRRLYIAESVAAERIDFLFGQVCEGYRKSIGEQKIVRETATDFGSPKTSTVIKHCTGDGRLAIAAARLATLGGKLPVNTFIATLPADLPEDFSEDDHPVEGCSRTAREQAVTANESSPEIVASDVAVDGCKLDAVGEQMLKVLNSRPVQRPERDELKRGLPLEKQLRRHAFLTQ